MQAALEGLSATINTLMDESVLAVHYCVNIKHGTYMFNSKRTSRQLGRQVEKMTEEYS